MLSKHRECKETMEDRKEKQDKDDPYSLTEPALFFLSQLSPHSLTLRRRLRSRSAPNYTLFNFRVNRSFTAVHILDSAASSLQGPFSSASLSRSNACRPSQLSAPAHPSRRTRPPPPPPLRPLMTRIGRTLRILRKAGEIRTRRR